MLIYILLLTEFFCDALCRPFPVCYTYMIYFFLSFRFFFFPCLALLAGNAHERLIFECEFADERYIFFLQLLLLLRWCIKIRWCDDRQYKRMQYYLKSVSNSIYVMSSFDTKMHSDICVGGIRLYKNRDTHTHMVFFFSISFDAHSKHARNNWEHIF